jgi:hypothetical protein
MIWVNGKIDLEAAEWLDWKIGINYMTPVVPLLNLLFFFRLCLGNVLAHQYSKRGFLQFHLSICTIKKRMQRTAQDNKNTQMFN